MSFLEKMRLYDKLVGCVFLDYCSFIIAFLRFLRRNHRWKGFLPRNWRNVNLTWLVHWC